MNILKKTDKLVRYENHMAFINTYIKMKSVPKGFILKFHNNMDFDVNGILKKCSFKLMKRTLSFYRCKIKRLIQEINKSKEIIYLRFSIYHNDIIAKLDKKTERINNIMLYKRKPKFIRDGLNIDNALRISNQFLHAIRSQPNTETTSNYNTMKEDLLKDIEIPSHDPIVLCDNPKFQESAFKSLCAKGPSFVPTPKTVNWNQLQTDFENFQNSVRREIHFAKSPQEATNKDDDDQPPKKCIERDLFINTSKRKLKSNLSKEENEALRYCTNEMISNPKSKEVIRLQDKGNKFVIVDKETDLKKAKQQILRSSMVKLKENPTEMITRKVQQWCTKWKDMGHLSKEWCTFILNKNARPAKNNPLYKTHKHDIPVRLLTSGCNSATENLSLFVERKCSSLAKNLKSKIKDTEHMLHIIDEINKTGVSNNAMLISLDIENMFSSIDNTRGM